MLGIAALTVFMSAPGQSFSVAAFVDPMLSELGIGSTKAATENDWPGADMNTVRAAIPSMTQPG